MWFVRIAIQGQAGSFHEEAAKQWLSDEFAIVPADTFRQAFANVKAGAADTLVVAIENSLYGSINEIYDLIEKYKFPIIGEVHLPIHHQLIGFSGTKLSNIQNVYSQLPALAQCTEYLDRELPQAEHIEHHDTAESVAYIKKLADPTNAAIASKRAAEVYGMQILDENIEDHVENYTRFLVLQPAATPPNNANRSSLVLTTSHNPGALAKVLTCFAEAGINLSKLQSRPIIGKPWKYKFYLVVEAAGDTLHSIVSKVCAEGNTVNILGEYVSTA